MLVHAGKNNYFTESYTREDFSSCADAGYAQNEKPEFRLWHACHLSGYFFDESNTEQIVFYRLTYLKFIDGRENSSTSGTREHSSRYQFFLRLNRVTGIFPPVIWLLRK